MKYRISRSFRLLVGSKPTVSDGSLMEIVADESSDEEGDLPMLKPRNCVRRELRQTQKFYIVM